MTSKEVGFSTSVIISDVPLVPNLTLLSQTKVWFILIWPNIYLATSVEPNISISQNMLYFYTDIAKWMIKYFFFFWAHRPYQLKFLETIEGSLKISA